MASFASKRFLIIVSPCLSSIFPVKRHRNTNNISILGADGSSMRTSPTGHFLIDCFYFNLMDKEICVIISIEVWSVITRYHKKYADNLLTLIHCFSISHIHKKWSINIPPARLSNMSHVVDDISFKY